ncbi:dihydropteroate synthase [Flavihumibacter stibioxidans]|uniref:dihydropteroate synthase n=1 Tax=Flavihumibacter stibioxidans TaxID=1834163 RepID=A0ABR7M3B6_9BACT|nr:dihydropteroate synthase [Flavihumibacter stibioxidans]MBC6489511.1 dihydropteroate synthase [Flavihumibacter stibioxidans]
MFTLNCKGRLLLLDKPVVMGIINFTPDSFFEASRKTGISAVLEQAGKMLQEGAAILDIGAQSTRPDSQYLDADTEWKRMEEILPVLCSSFPDVIISADTFHHRVAARAVEAGAHIINDISGGLMDPEMIPTVGALGVPYVCMHMKGTPQTMQSLAQYRDIALEVVDYFSDRIAACKAAGIKDIILDPGLGFAKTIPQNFELLNKLDALHIHGYPLLLGISRKSMITRTLGRISAADALNGTTVLNTLGLTRGVHILRVHDVKEAVQAVELFREFERGRNV